MTPRELIAELGEGELAHYVACIEAGTSHNLALMFAKRQPPMSNTDKEFLAGHVNGNQFEKTPWIGDGYRTEAEAAGVSTTGKVYLSQLADFPGDPKAWVGGRGDVQRVCEERGLACTGAVNVKGNRSKSEEQVRLADDIVESLATKMVEDVGASGISMPEAREAVVAKHSPKFKE